MSGEPSHEQAKDQRQLVPLRAKTGRHRVPERSRRLLLHQRIGHDRGQEDERGKNAEQRGEREQSERKEDGREDTGEEDKIMRTRQSGRKRDKTRKQWTHMTKQSSLYWLDER